MQVTDKPVRLPKLIVLATLPETAKDAIEEWDLESGGLDLNLEEFAPEERPGMETALGFLPGLTPFQRGLVQDGLLDAYEGSHARKAAFYRLIIDYAIGGTGIEIKNRTVDENGTCGPMEFIFSEGAVV
jgi:hypothetical protein